MENNASSGVATVLMVLGVLEIIGGIILGIMLASVMYEGGFMYFMICAITGVFFGILLIAGAKVVELLTEIRNDLKSMNKKSASPAAANAAQTFENLPRL